jgi:hypothetical protein
MQPGRDPDLAAALCSVYSDYQLNLVERAGGGLPLQDASFELVIVPEPCDADWPSEPVKTEHLFSQGRRLVLLEGPADSGKTACSQWLAQQWAFGRSDLLRFDLVVRCELEELARVSDWREWRSIIAVASGNKVALEAVSSRPHEMTRVLWVFDSLDKAERLPSSEAFRGWLATLCQAEWGYDECVLITTRPERSSVIRLATREWPHGFTRVQLKGLSAYNIERYIDLYFGQSLALASPLKCSLQQPGFLREACRTPFLLELVCFVVWHWGGGGALTQLASAYSLHHAAVLILLKRGTDGKAGAGEQPPHVDMDGPWVRALECLACSEKDHYAASDIAAAVTAAGYPESLDDGQLMQHCGMLSVAAADADQEQAFKFVHESFREFFLSAAWFRWMIDGRSAQESASQVIASWSGKHLRCNSLLLLCERLAGTPASTALLGCLSESFAQLCGGPQCGMFQACELGLVEFVRHLMRHPQVDLRKFQSGPDVESGSCLMLALKRGHVNVARLLVAGVPHINLANGWLGDSGLETLAAALCSPLNRGEDVDFNAASALTSINLYHNLISLNGCRDLVSLLSISTLKSLDLEGSQLGPNIAVLAAALATNSSLTSLNLCGAGLQDGAAHLADALMRNTTLTSLNLRSNAITDAGIVSIAAALETNRTLTNLNLRGQ